jgi:hypothetical protein
MATEQDIRSAFMQRRRDAYGQVIAAPGWSFVLLDLLAYCGQTPNDVRSAGRYDVVARMLARAEGPITLPEVKTDG